VRLPSRRSDDADLIRDRLRALLHENRPPGWVPADDEEPADPGEGPRVAADADLPTGFGRHRAPGTAVRVAPGRRAAWSLWVVGLLAALLVVGGTWLGRPQVEPAPVEPAPAASPTEEGPAATPSVGVAAETAATVVVSVVGTVARPGLVTLPEGARVADAIAAAGGLLPEADATRSTSPRWSPTAAGGGRRARRGGGRRSPRRGDRRVRVGPVDLNAATAADLDALPGIGPVLAQRIVEHRERSGPFRSVEQLDDVPGIGPATYAELAELVAV
jgi:competence protein ComEA